MKLIFAFYDEIAVYIYEKLSFWSFRMSQKNRLNLKPLSVLIPFNRLEWLSIKNWKSFQSPSCLWGTQLGLDSAKLVSPQHLNWASSYSTQNILNLIMLCRLSKSLRRLSSAQFPSQTRLLFAFSSQNHNHDHKHNHDDDHDHGHSHPDFQTVKKSPQISEQTIKEKHALIDKVRWSTCADYQIKQSRALHEGHPSSAFVRILQLCCPGPQALPSERLPLCGCAIRCCAQRGDQEVFKLANLPAASNTIWVSVSMLTSN